MLSALPVPIIVPAVTAPPTVIVRFLLPMSIPPLLVKVVVVAAVDARNVRFELRLSVFPVVLTSIAPVPETDPITSVPAVIWPSPVTW